MAYRHHIPGSALGSGTSGFYYQNSPFGDTTFTKVFVGGLAWETQSETLHQYFEQFGEILEAVVITDKHTGRSKGYGFVTFRDPDSARRACADPNPVIDGRRANCNLASLRRSWSAFPIAHMRPGGSLMGSGSMPVPQGVFLGNTSFQQPAPYSYPQGFAYPQYRYITYEPELVYPQNVYNPYIGQQLVPLYGGPGTANPVPYPFGQWAQPLASGQGYATVPGFTVPTPQVVPIGGSNFNGMAPISSTPAVYPHGMALPVPAQPQFVVSAPSSQFTQASGSDHTTG